MARRRGFVQHYTLILEIDFCIYRYIAFCFENGFAHQLVVLVVYQASTAAGISVLIVFNAVLYLEGSTGIFGFLVDFPIGTEGCYGTVPYASVLQVANRRNGSVCLTGHHQLAAVTARILPGVGRRGLLRSLNGSLHGSGGLHRLDHRFLKGVSGHALGGLRQLDFLGLQILAARKSLLGHGGDLGLGQVYLGELLALVESSGSDGFQGFGELHFLDGAASKGVFANGCDSVAQNDFLDVAGVLEPGHQFETVIVPHAALALNGQHAGFRVIPPCKVLAALASGCILCHCHYAARQETNQQQTAQQCAKDACE